MKMLNKKGQVVDQLKGFIMGIVVIAIVLGIGLYMLQQFSTTIKGTATSTVASNATDDLITKLATAPTWIGLLIVVVFATAILAYFYMR